MVEKYFNENNKYTKPTLIKFEIPKEIRFVDLGKFLDYYKPFACSEVYMYAKFEYGDFDNYVEAIIESESIDPKYCKFVEKSEGMFKAGETIWSIMSKFWYYRENYPFWNEPLHTGYNGGITKHSVFLHDVTIQIQGVYIISDADKRAIEIGEKNEK